MRQAGQYITSKKINWKDCAHETTQLKKLETLRGYLIQYPHLRKYFFGNTEIATDDAEYDRDIGIAEIYLNYLEHITVLQDSFGKKNIASRKRFTNNAFEKSPILLKHLLDNAPLYSDALHQMVKETNANR